MLGILLLKTSSDWKRSSNTCACVVAVEFHDSSCSLISAVNLGRSFPSCRAELQALTLSVADSSFADCCRSYLETDFPSKDETYFACMRGAVDGSINWEQWYAIGSSMLGLPRMFVPTSLVLLLTPQNYQTFLCCFLRVCSATFAIVCVARSATDARRTTTQAQPDLGMPGTSVLLRSKKSHSSERLTTVPLLLLRGIRVATPRARDERSAVHCIDCSIIYKSVTLFRLHIVRQSASLSDCVF